MRFALGTLWILAAISSLKALIERFPNRKGTQTRIPRGRAAIFSTQRILRGRDPILSTQRIRGGDLEENRHFIEGKLVAHGQF